jgi:hypothetical protein
MIALCFNGLNNAGKLPETVTSSQLTEHHDKQLVPTGECFNPFITAIFFYNHIKGSFRQKGDYLTENILSIIHHILVYIQVANLGNEFKSTRDFYDYNYIYIKDLQRFLKNSFGH